MTWRWRRVCGQFGLLAGALGPGGAAAAAEHPCPGPHAVIVQATDAVDAADACRGADRAAAFLVDHGMAVPPGLRVELVDSLPSDLRADAAGCYLRGPGRTMVLVYAAFAPRRTWYGVPVDRRLYSAVVAHEMAHAIVACAPGAAVLAGPAHEYVAYVAMFAAMDPDLREQALAAYPGDGFRDSTQINPFVYGFDPMMFGAQAWRHFRKQPDPKQFLRDMAEGRVVEAFEIY